MFVTRAVSPRVFRVLLLTGLILRAAGLPSRGTVDLDVWKLWTYVGSVNVTTMYGIGGSPPERAVLAWEHRRGTVEYPPATLFALSVVGRIYRAIDPTYTDGPALSATVKLSILLGDIGVCLALWSLLRRAGPEAQRLAVLFYWLNPAVIVDGAFLGYLDPWLGALTMAALLALERDAFFVCGAVIALTVATKLQIILILPAIALRLLRRSGTRWVTASAAATAGAALIAAIVLAPFARIGALPNLIQGAGRAFHHDMLSAEATNVWWIATWLLRASYAVQDLGAWAAWTMPVRILGISRAMELGYPNARAIGTVLSTSVMLWAFWRARRASLPVVLASCAFAIHAYTLLSVQVHENHFYLALPLIAAAGTLLPRLRAPYALASGVCLFNLLLFQGLGRDLMLPLRRLTIVDASVILSFVNIGALIWHAQRFAAVSSSHQAASPPAIDLDGDPVQVRRSG